MSRAPLRVPGWTAVLPVLLAIVAVLPSVTGEPVWDDVFWSRQIAWFTSLGAVLSPPPDIPDWPRGYFRPTATLSYVLDHWLYGADWNRGRHFTNILAHALATLGVWLLARRLLRDRPQAALGALLAALVHAVHPIHIESVGWIGARVDVLATLFLLPTALLALAWRDRRSVPALLALPACFLLALGGKEVAVTGLVLVPLVLWLAPPVADAPPPRAIATWLPVGTLLLVAVGVYAGLRVAGSDSVVGDIDAPDATTLIRASGYYVIKLVWPWPHLNYAVWSQVPALPMAVLAVAAALAATVAAAWARRRGHGATPLLGLLWSGVALAPSLVIALSSFAANPVAERYLYLPSVGLALALGATVAELAAGRWRAPALGIAAALLLAGLAGSVLRSYDWSDNVRLWSSATRQVRDNGQPWVELGSAQYVAGDLAGALATFAVARTLPMAPETLAVAEYNAGLAHLKRVELAAALAAFDRAAAANRRYPLAHYGRGRALYEQALATGELAARRRLLTQARLAFSTTVGLDPSFGDPRLQLVRVLRALGDTERARGADAAAQAHYRDARTRLEPLILALPSLAADPEIQALREWLAQQLQQAD
jgi:tetratricopeptide (TPR) repeat protein